MEILQARRARVAAERHAASTFTLDKSDFGFFDDRGELVVEPGQVDVYAGSSSAAELKKSFTVRR